MATTQNNIVDRAIWRVSGRFGTHAKEVERFIKFFIVGIIGFVVDFTTLNILQLTVLVPIDPNHNEKIAAATGISFCAAVISNFIWNRYWTYPDSRSKSVRRQLVMFFAINVIAMIFRLIFVSASFDFFAGVGHDLLVAANVTDNLTVELEHQVGTNISQAIAVIIAMFWNFGANRFITYSDVPSGSVEPVLDES